MHAIWRVGLCLSLVVGLGVVLSIPDAPTVCAQPPADWPAGTVLVWGFSELGRSQSTGVLIDPQERLIVGSYHALSRSESVVFFSPIWRDGKPEPDPQPYQQQYNRKEARSARPIHIDPARDVVVLRADDLPEGLQAARLAEGLPGEGDSLRVVGNPAQRNSLFEQQAAKAKRASVREWVYVDGQGVYAEFLEVSVEGTPAVGYSGGPVVNAKGELVSVMTAEQPDASGQLLCLSVAELRRAWAGALRQLALAAGKDDKMLTDYCQRAAKLDGDTAALPTIRGLLHERAGATDQAHTAYTEALHRNPLYPAAWLGWIRSRGR